MPRDCVWRKLADRDLVERAARDCFALGNTHAYLCARPALTSFYERLGWLPVERDVGGQGLTVFIRDAPA